MLTQPEQSFQIRTGKRKLTPKGVNKTHLGRLEAAEEGLEELTTTCRVAALSAEVLQWLLPPLAGPLWANGGCVAWA